MLRRTTVPLLGVLLVFAIGMAYPLTGRLFRHPSQGEISRVESVSAGREGQTPLLGECVIGEGSEVPLSIDGTRFWVNPEATAVLGKKFIVAGYPNYIWLGAEPETGRLDNTLFGVVLGGEGGADPIPSPIDGPIHSPFLAPLPNGLWFSVFGELLPGEDPLSGETQAIWSAIWDGHQWTDISQLPVPDGFAVPRLRPWEGSLLVQGGEVWFSVISEPTEAALLFRYGGSGWTLVDLELDPPHGLASGVTELALGPTPGAAVSIVFEQLNIGRGGQGHSLRLLRVLEERTREYELASWEGERTRRYFEALLDGEVAWVLYQDPDLRLLAGKWRESLVPIHLGSGAQNMDSRLVGLSDGSALVVAMIRATDFGPVPVHFHLVRPDLRSGTQMAHTPFLGVHAAELVEDELALLGSLRREFSGSSIRYLGMMRFPVICGAESGGGH